MSEKIIQNLEGVSETLLMTLYARAHESQPPDAMLKDDKAVEIVRQLTGDFSQLRMQRHDEIAIIMRMRKFDKHAHDFLAPNPNSIVIHIGCGLDTRFERVDNGQVEWYDLDLPNVIDLRRGLIGDEVGSYHLFDCSVLDTAWMNKLTWMESRFGDEKCAASLPVSG